MNECNNLLFSYKALIFIGLDKYTTMAFLICDITTSWLEDIGGSDLLPRPHWYCHRIVSVTFGDSSNMSLVPFIRLLVAVKCLICCLVGLEMCL